MEALSITDYIIIAILAITAIIGIILAIQNLISDRKRELPYFGHIPPPTERPVQFIELSNENESESGFEYLLYNEKWINEDYNPKGIRIGFLDDVSGWVTAKWCNYHDCYHTRTSIEDDVMFEDFKCENQIPTHFMEIPDTQKLIK